MRTNLKVILSAVGVAALLASPAMAKTVRSHAPIKNIPSDARGSVAPLMNEGGPYSPSIPTSPYRGTRDFQNDSRG
jgi:hypothetical protein